MSRKKNMFGKHSVRIPSIAPMALFCGAMLAAAHGASAQSVQAPAEGDVLQEIVVTGVRAAEEKAVELKREAFTIQDSIAAEDIGKLPDTTISDSLQRITGVQINREAGEGTSVNIRGLPQVGTLLNGEGFLTTSSIVTTQPDFGDIPSQLFSGADVSKSTTASLLGAGITGTINLKTRRPYDLDDGWTVATAAQAVHGTRSDEYEPQFDTLIGFRGRSWGVLASAAYSKLTLENSVDGMDQYGGKLFGETTDSTVGADGFLNAYLGAPLPSGMILLDPANCAATNGVYSAATASGCDVDVNGDGIADSSFFGTQNFTAFDRQLERERLGFNLSFQADLGESFTLTSDVFYTDQQRYNRTAGVQLNSANWNGAAWLPIQSRDTGVSVHNGFNGGNSPMTRFHTTQVYRQYIGTIETFAETQTEESDSRNFNLQLHYDSGGNFTADVRGIYGKAQELHMQSYAQFAVSDGALWPNSPADVAPPGTYVYPDGNRVFNPYGFAANTVPATIDMRGDHLSIGLPSDLQATLRNPNAYSLKTITSEGNYDRSATMKVLRADGHYKMDDIGMSFDFGVRYGDRTAENDSFALIAPVYGGLAYRYEVDPVTGQETGVRVADPTGCYVRYKAVDILLNGFSRPGECIAGDPATGFYRANTLSALRPGQLPGLLGNNMQFHGSLGGVNGIGVHVLDPSVMDNVLAFQNALYPGNIRNVDPAGTWQVDVEQTTGYVQGNYAGELGVPFRANFGAKIVRTDLRIGQHQAGQGGAYYINPEDLGVTNTDRSFTDVLPALNLAFDLRENLKLRFAYAKNMQLLDLDQWGGGLMLNHGIIAGTSPPVFGVFGGSQIGNPRLDPWRSANYDISLEYYFARSSVLSLAAFYVDVESFISRGSVLRCDLPDLDGVVRGRCVAIDGPVQGEGKSLRGLELGLKMPFYFLPGWLSDFGIDTNLTYSPSDVGRDVAGNTIPFQDNSKEQANMVLWYQNDRFQARLAGNYRSKRAVSQNYAGIAGFQAYQAPTFYLDASVSYDVTPGLQLFLHGSNILGEVEDYYLVWPDQKLNTTRFEPRYTLGARARF